ncbi:hypothetical protein [Cryptosporangium sp. NPDC048952]|uniref:hypothetical protein n=1 Tax=Cryptosporangium sp. NPDC048952 TaxID=3363961 RepID=UPI00371FCF9C
MKCVDQRRPGGTSFFWRSAALVGSIVAPGTPFGMRIACRGNPTVVSCSDINRITSTHVLL